MRRRVIGTCVALVGFMVLSLTGSGRAFSVPNPVPPPGFAITVAIGGHGELTTPTAMAVSADGRMFVAEQTGRIKEFDGAGDTTATVVANLSKDVYSGGGHGLLSIALDPQFPTRPYLYALYSRDAKTRGGTTPGWNDTCPDNANGCVTYSRLVRMTLAGNVATGTLKMLVDDWCSQFGHTIGALLFGPDGNLYVGAGDGSTQTTTEYGQFGAPDANPCGDPPGGFGVALSPPLTEGGSLRAQDVRTDTDPAGLDGTIIRINPNTGAAVAGNPYSASADANKRRVIVYGGRNPFRAAFRPTTNQLWITDNGWNTFNEINKIANVKDAVVENFGWPCYEGTLAQPLWQALAINLCGTLYTANTATKPAFTYAHAKKVVAGESCPSGASSPTGIAFYQGTNYPAAFDGALFFADYSRQCMWVVPPDANGAPVFANRQTFANLAPARITDVKAGSDGDLYLVDIAGNQILHVEYVAGA